MKSISSFSLVFLVAVWIVLFDNISFFRHLLEVYPFNSDYAPFIISQVVLLFLVFTLLFSVFGWRYTLKPLLIFFLLLSATENYFMVSYNILVDKTMIENMIATDTAEALDLMSWVLLGYIMVLGVLPAWFVYRIPVVYSTIFTKVKTILLIVLVMFLLLFSFSKYYASFFREHKIIRYYTNPLQGLFSLGTYVKEQFQNQNIPLTQIGLDAKQKLDSKRKIVIMVVGEAVRADHLSLNGYKKETMPLLGKEDIFNFKDVWSCGTTTAVSVPCMFSIYTRHTYDSSKGEHTQNALDVLDHAGVEVLWRDNNSDSKGVATRLNYQSYKTAATNSICEEECRDVGMLVGLKERIESSNKDIIIVLHQMGNHGPAYYKRYPKAFEKFNPTCQTNQLEQCSQEEIANSYDNALLYTDYFLAQVIALLKSYDSETSQSMMLYMSDHGESLGEGGFYLHGLPYFMAPDAQTHIPLVMWFSKGYTIDRNKLVKQLTLTWSQDNLFSTLLGLFGVQSKVYRPKDDLLNSMED